MMFAPYTFSLGTLFTLALQLAIMWLKNQTLSLPKPNITPGLKIKALFWQNK
jgi:hypothetical protein